MIGNKNCVFHLFSRRFTDFKAKKSVLLCFKRFLKIQKKSAPERIFLLDKGKLETESDIRVGSGESIRHERIIPFVVGKE